MVRLKDWELEGIKKSIHQFLPSAKVFLYGSRTDDAKKGGDIDLLVELDQLPDLEVKSKIKLTLYDAIGEQKIDITYVVPGEESSFVKMIEGQRFEI